MWHMRSWFPDQGLNLCPIHWKLGILTTGPLEKSLISFFDQTFSLNCAVYSKLCSFLSNIWWSERERGFWSEGLVFDGTPTEFRLEFVVKSTRSLTSVLYSNPNSNQIHLVTLGELWSLIKSTYNISRTWGEQHTLVSLPLFFYNPSFRIQ